MISIIVPIYKIENFLPECIESLLSQTYRDIEIILVNDGSPDKCPEICEKYAAKFSNIKVLHQTNHGLVSARQAGLQLSSGEFIGYVDGDDWVESNMFQELYECQKNCNADVVVAGFTKEIGSFQTKHFNSIACGFYDKVKLKSSVYPYMLYDMHSNVPGIYTYAWNKLFRRQLIYQKQMDIPGKISIGEDAALVYPALLAAKSICVTENCSYHYRQRKSSMLKDLGALAAKCNAVKNLYQFFLKILSSLKTAEKNSLYNLEFQIERYILLMLISMTGGVIVNSDNTINFFGYEKSITKGKILIYGAGTVGQHLYNTLSLIKNSSLSIEWIDPDYSEYRKHGLAVNAVNSISEQNFDIVIIAMLDKKRIAVVRDDLINMGVAAEKISEINFASNLNVNKIFSKFKISGGEEV